MATHRRLVKIRNLPIYARITALFLAVTVLFVPLPASAQSAPAGLALTPLRTELEIAPGTSLTRTLTVQNTTTAEMIVQLSTESFSTINPQYDYKFDDASELASWVVYAPDYLVLQPGETRDVPFTVGVPLNSEPGGRYISLFASSDSPPIDGVNARQRVGSLLYITVTGDVSRIGKLYSLYTPWLITSSVPWTMNIQNSGSTHFHSRSSLTLRTLLGEEVSVTNGDSLILPGTIRSIESIIPTPLWPGVYIAEYQIGLGDTPGVSETKLLIYAPPLFTLAIICIGILVALYLLRRSYRRRQAATSSAEQPYK